MAVEKNRNKCKPKSERKKKRHLEIKSPLAVKENGEYKFNTSVYPYKILPRACYHVFTQHHIISVLHEINYAYYFSENRKYCLGITNLSEFLGIHTDVCHHAIGVLYSLGFIKITSHRSSATTILYQFEMNYETLCKPIEITQDLVEEIYLQYCTPKCQSIAQVLKRSETVVIPKSAMLSMGEISTTEKKAPCSAWGTDNETAMLSMGESTKNGMLSMDILKEDKNNKEKERGTDALSDSFFETLEEGDEEVLIEKKLRTVLKSKFAERYPGEDYFAYDEYNEKFLPKVISLAKSTPLVDLVKVIEFYFSLSGKPGGTGKNENLYEKHKWSLTDFVHDFLDLKKASATSENTSMAVLTPKMKSTVLIGQIFKESDNLKKKDYLAGNYSKEQISVLKDLQNELDTAVYNDYFNETGEWKKSCLIVVEAYVEAHNLKESFFVTVNDHKKINFLQRISF